VSSAPAYPSHIRWVTLLGFLLSVWAGAFFIVHWAKAQQPSERYDLWAYVRTSLPQIPYWHTYTVAMDGKHLAREGDPITHLEKLESDPETLRAWLQDNVYHQPLWLLLKWPLAGFGLAFFIALMLGSWIDRKRNADARDGTILRGPRLISKWAWNREVKRDNRGFWIKTR
jgi:hypothetical protein